MKLNDISRSGSVKNAAPKNPVQVTVPADFAIALTTHQKAKEIFEKFPPSHCNEYIKWISEAKTDLTRQKRIATALKRISEEKG